MERMSVADFRKLKTKGNKYNAKKTFYNGRWYDSKKEADFSKRLNSLKHAHNTADRVVRIEYQVPYDIYIKTKHVFTYFADFRVIYHDLKQTVFDVKGTKSGAAYAMFRLKKKCVKAYYKIEIKEI